MPRSTILLLYLLLLATPCVAQTATTAIEIPFAFQKGLIIVDAKIKDSVPVKVVLATGMEHSVTDPSLLQKYELGAYYAADGPVTGRNDKTFSFTKVSGVKIGNSKSKELMLRFGSVAGLSSMAGQEIFAALGADFFAGQILQIDFKNSVVRFLEQIPPDLIDSKNPNFNAARATVLRVAPKADEFVRKTYMVSLVKDVQINGQKTNLLFDSGIATVLALSASTGKKVGLTVPAETEPPREEKITLRFESNELPDVPATIYPKGTGVDQNLSKSGGAVAGSFFLQKFVATFDYKKGVVVLERF
ncbi:MAG TPA: retropepsin-like aspartic protease [Pyrinomonadaceae bacterium]|nr:retropepsin-like aspartic protease [Pyrinomonadaceae bacterium]